MDNFLPVLVVDDEVVLLSFLTTALERSGFNVVAAASGTEALALLERGNFAGIVSDLRMPEIGGAQIYDWVAQHRPELSCRFLFITGNISDPHALELQQRSGALLIEKPFRIVELMEQVRKIISGREQAAND